MILMYHKIFPKSPTLWWVNIDNFYRQLCELKAYEVVYLSDYNPRNPNQVVITFDDGYENILHFAAPLLKKFSYPFEVFINGAYLGKDNSFDNKIEPKAKIIKKAQIKELIKFKARLEWHCFHHNNLGLETNEKKINKELTIPKFFLQFDKKSFKWLSYPYGVFNETLKDTAKKKFEGAVSCQQGNNSELFCLNRITVTNNSSFKKHTIAVLIPCYNYGPYLIEALESVINQTRPVDEIIIADDCSIDNTQEISEFYQSRYPAQIKYIRNKIRMGIVNNYNHALRTATSDYLCILDADNYYVSNFIEKTAEILDINEKIGVVYTDFALFGLRARTKYEMFPLEWRDTIKVGQYFIIRAPDLNNKTKEILKDRNFIHGNSLYRKSAFVQVGGYIKHEKLPEDHYLFYRMIKAGWLAKRVPQALLAYRQHSQNQENDSFNFFAELNYYKNKSYEAEKQITFYQKQYQQLENEIKSSKLWRFQRFYNNLRKSSKLPNWIKVK